MPQHTQCLLCNSENLVSLKRYKNSFLCKCKACNFIFSQQIPSQTELIDFYDGYGRNDYLSPLTIKRYNELLDDFEKFRVNNKILDVGCGIGYFLEVAKKRGWEVYGTEYTDKAIEICTSKGINMNQGELNRDNYTPNFFDIITSFEVLEHINNPVNEIQNFHILLRKGGLVYLTTPNFNSLLRYKLKEKYDVITYPEHLSYYTKLTLNQLFSNNGFKKRKIQTTGISISRLKASDGRPVIKVISEKSDDEKLRKQIDQSVWLQNLKKIVNAFLTILGIGDSLKGWFEKK